MNIMVGYPWENQESVKATAEIANKYRISLRNMLTLEEPLYMNNIKNWV